MKKLLTVSLMALAIAGTATSAEAFSLTKFFSSASNKAKELATKAGPVIQKAHEFVSNPENQKKIGDTLAKGLSAVGKASGSIAAK